MDSRRDRLLSATSSKIVQSSAPGVVLTEIEEQIAHADAQAVMWLDEVLLRQEYLESLSLRLEELVEGKEEPRALIEEARRALADAEVSIGRAKELFLELPAAVREALESGQRLGDEGG